MKDEKLISVSVFITTHNLKHFDNIPTEVLVLHGKLVLAGKPDVVQEATKSTNHVGREPLNTFDFDGTMLGHSVQVEVV